MSGATFGSRFANPKRTKPVALGPCRCPDAPHADGDSAAVRAEIGDGEARRASARGAYADGPTFNGQGADDESIATFTVSWNLLDDGGKPAEINAETVGLLDDATRTVLLAAVADSIGAREGAVVPKTSGGRSPASSPGSGSPRRRRTTRSPR